MKLEEDIHQIDNRILYQCCEDIKIWQTSGVLPYHSTLSKIAKDYEMEPRDVENMVLDEVVDRHRDIISLIVKNRISVFLK